MRIISKFKDYYDNAISSFGYDAIDPKLIYVRQTDSIYLDYYKKSQNEYSSIIAASCNVANHFTVGHTGAIAFCGKLYPFYNVNLNPFISANIRDGVLIYNEKLATTFYSFDSFVACINGEKLRNYLANYYNGMEDGKKEIEINRAIKFWKDKLDEQFFHEERNKKYCGDNLRCIKRNEERYVNQTVNDELFILHNSPVFAMYSVSPGKGYELIINPRLNEFNFAEKFDTYSAFQEISMYIGNNLAKQVDPTVNFSDELKCEIAGFDKVTSFRKEKQKK